MEGSLSKEKKEPYMYVGKINEICTDYDHGSHFRM